MKDEELHAKIDQLMQHIGNVGQQIGGMGDKIGQGMQQMATVHNQTAQALHKALTSEKEVVRDPKTGKPIGVRIKQDPKEIAQGLRN